MFPLPPSKDDPHQQEILKLKTFVPPPPLLNIPHQQNVSSAIRTPNTIAMNSRVEDEYNELLQAETFVDLERLKDMARHGIPFQLRGEVWKYLLNVASIDKSEEITKAKRLQLSYERYDARPQNTLKHLSKKIKSEIQQHVRLLSNHILSKEKQSQLFQVLLSFLHYSEMTVQYDAGLVTMCLPFVISMEQEYEIFYSFYFFIKKVCYGGSFQMNSKLQWEVGKLMMLLRCTQPELYQYFESEELEPNEWALQWLRYYLSRELPLPCVLRLWDTYLATNDWDLHTYVCLSVLQYHTEVLMEYEYSELRYYLKHLPVMDMDKIIKQAYNIRAQVKARELL